MPLFLILFLLSFQALSCEITDIIGKPIINDIVLCRIEYAVGYNEKTKTPFWVAEHLTKDMVDGPENRIGNFKADIQLPNNIRANLSDYMHSGYSRGHMAAAGNHRNNIEAMKQTFLLSNMVPQIQVCNNAGIFSTIEEKIRDYAIKFGEIYVITGPIYSGNNDFIGNKVYIPDHLYKLIYNPKLKETIGFIIENIQLCGMDIDDTVVNQNKIEEITGILFFPNVIYERGNKLW